MADMLPKIKEARRIADAADHPISVQVDGGIGDATIGLVAEAGADNFVVGTAFFKADDRRENTEKLRRVAEEKMNS